MTTDYSTVTEVPGVGASQEQLARFHHRYELAAQYCHGKGVLEVACGSGIGLGCLARSGSRVVGGDYTGNLVRMAHEHYHQRVHLLQLDAHALPFRDSSFDTVVLFEALYYLNDLGQFIQESHRILRNAGTLMICTVNKDWSDFNPSPFSTRYYSGYELCQLLTKHGFKAELFGAFPVTKASLSQKVVSLIKRAAVRLHLIPGSMKSKEWLKRIFYGRLVSLPAELDNQSNPLAPPVPISAQALTSQYKVLYVIGHC